MIGFANQVRKKSAVRRCFLPLIHILEIVLIFSFKKKIIVFDSNIEKTKKKSPPWLLISSSFQAVVTGQWSHGGHRTDSNNSEVKGYLVKNTNKTEYVRITESPRSTYSGVWLKHLEVRTPEYEAPRSTYYGVWSTSKYVLRSIYIWKIEVKAAYVWTWYRCTYIYCDGLKATN